MVQLTPLRCKGISCWMPAKKADILRWCKLLRILNALRCAYVAPLRTAWKVTPVIARNRAQKYRSLPMSVTDQSKLRGCLFIEPAVMPVSLAVINGVVNPLPDVSPDASLRRLKVLGERHGYCRSYHRRASHSWQVPSPSYCDLVVKRWCRCYSRWSGTGSSRTQPTTHALQ